MFEGWEYKEDELVPIETVGQRQVEKKIEEDVKTFLEGIGIPITRIPETPSAKTPDYEGMEVDFEVSGVKVYFPASIGKKLEDYSQVGKC